MNILLLGNGFDVAHGLPTRYQDFLVFLSNYRSFLEGKAYDPIYKDFFNNYFEDKYKRELNSCVVDNKLIDYFLRIYEDRVAAGKVGWIDFENEISSIIQAFDAADDYCTALFDEGYSEAVLEFKEWKYLGLLLFGETDFEKSSFYRLTNDSISKYISSLEDNLNKLIRALELYLSCFVAFIVDSDYRKELDHCDFTKMNISFLINFNYTNTYNYLYRNDNNHVSQCHVHGFAVQEHISDNANMVLGINEYLNNDRKDSDNKFYMFKKFYQRIM